jgi:hypothetical protein
VRPGRVQRRRELRERRSTGRYALLLPRELRPGEPRQLPAPVPGFGSGRAVHAAQRCGARAANAGAACSSDAECLPASDDECQRIVYPSCVAGATVDALVHAAEEVLSGGSSTLCGGQPAALTEALDLVNRTFDGCGKVIDCGLLD